MTKIYSQTFAISELDRERDQVLFLRMKALDFVRPVHLDLPESYAGLEAVTRAQEQLAKINNYKVRSLCQTSCYYSLAAYYDNSNNEQRKNPGRLQDSHFMLYAPVYLQSQVSAPQLMQ